MATMTMDYGMPKATPIRLTARGRAVVRVALGLLLALLGLVSVGNLDASRVFASTAPAAAPAAHLVVVQPGETLWQIAARELPGIDPREGISRIRERNGMAPTDVLVAGSAISVPLG